MTQPKQMFSWMNPNLEIRETGRHGKGVYTTAAIAADEMLFVIGGYVLTIEDENNLRGLVADKPIEISEHFSIGPRRPADLARMPQHYVNHSCEPNAGFKGQIFIQAMRSIAAGEEITYDYAMVMHPNPESSSFFTMECLCGRPNCRWIVTENDWQSSDLQRKYDGWFQWFLQEKIDRAKRDMEATGHGRIQLDEPKAGIEKLRGGGRNFRPRTSSCRGAFRHLWWIRDADCRRTATFREPLVELPISVERLHRAVC